MVERLILFSDIIDSLYYARWDTGEVDIVYVDASNQKPQWVVEVKWSDAPLKDARLLKNAIEFVKKNSGSESFKNKREVLVTTKTQYGQLSMDHTQIVFKPSSEYAYVVSKELLSSKIRQLDLHEGYLDG